MSEKQDEQERIRRVIEFHKIQAEFFGAVRSEQYSYLMYGGAIRGGKTWLALLTLIMLCRVFPKSRWAVVRKDEPSLMRNTIPSFNNVRPQEFISAPRGQVKVARCSNGSEIIFFPEAVHRDPDYDRWKGLEVNGFVLEEANELDERTFHKAIERAGSWKCAGPRQPKPYIILTCNPARNWVMQRFYIPWSQGRLKAPYYFQRALPRDNPHLTTTYVDGLKNLEAVDKGAYKRFVEGDWNVLDDPQQLISFEWLLRAQTVERVPGARALGVDVARFGDDYSCIAERDGNALVAMERMHGLSTTQLGEVVAKRISDTATSPGLTRIDEVGLGAGVVDHCRAAHFDVYGFNGSHTAPHDDAFPTFKFKNYRGWSWWKVREALRQGLIAIDVEDTSRLFQDLASPRYTISGDKCIHVESKDDLKKRLGRSPDEGDAFVMAFADDPNSIEGGLSLGSGLGSGERRDPALNEIAQLGFR